MLCTDLGETLGKNAITGWDTILGSALSYGSTMHGLLWRAIFLNLELF